MRLQPSEFRVAESALRESEERFRKLVQGAPDGVAILRQGIVVYLNERAGRMRAAPAAVLAGPAAVLTARART